LGVISLDLFWSTFTPSAQNSNDREGQEGTAASGLRKRCQKILKETRPCTVENYGVLAVGDWGAVAVGGCLGKGYHRGDCHRVNSTGTKSAIEATFQLD